MLSCKDLTPAFDAIIFAQASMQKQATGAIAVARSAIEPQCHCLLNSGIHEDMLTINRFSRKNLKT